MNKIITLSVITLFASQFCMAQSSVDFKKGNRVLAAKVAPDGYYEWTVNTTRYTYEGTSSTLKNTEKVMVLAAGKEIVMGRKIIWIPIRRYNKK